MGTKQPPLPPFSLRLSFEERAQLERDAAGLSLGADVRERIFDGSTPSPRRRGKFPVKDQKALASVLAMLGQSRLANNLNQLAHAANTGSLAMTPALIRVEDLGTAKARERFLQQLNTLSSLPGPPHLQNLPNQRSGQPPSQSADTTRRNLRSGSKGTQRTARNP